MATETARQKQIWCGALLVAVTLILYLPVLHHEFLTTWDDNGYVTANPHVRTGLKPANLVWAFSTFEQYNWHPLTWLSHMLDCQVFGLNAGPHHYVNVLIHSANVLLLFWLLCQATNMMWRSFVAAALFAVHPLNVETVAWVAQRKSLLSVLFSLLTFAAYGWYVRHGGWKRYALVLLALALALMSKPMAVTLPLLLLMLDEWPLHRFDQLPFWRRWSKLTIEKIPFFLACAGASAVTLLAQRSGGSVVPFNVLPMSTRLENAAISCVAYLAKILFPAKLAAFYPHPASTLGPSLSVGEVAASAVILLGITAVAFVFERARYLAAGWLFFLVGLVPVLGFVQVGYQGMADRYAYFPWIGVLVVLVWGVSDVLDQAAVRREVLFASSLCLIALYSSATVRNLSFWKDDVTLFSHARAVWGRPDPYLEQLYANALLSSGRVNDALDHYRTSCKLGRNNELCHYHIAKIMFDRHQLPDAIRECETTLSLTANRALALSCLDIHGESLLEMGEYEGAQNSVTEALRIDPTDATALRLAEQINGISH